jgi:LacI family transcriptional regulator
MTIHDVAAKAGVSKSTVSLALQGSPLIRPETADRVREAAARIGYVYNRRAGELRRKSSNVIGVVINDLMNPFFAEVLVGIERKLVDAGYIVLMAHTAESLQRQEQVLMSMREQSAASIILCPALGTPKSLVSDVQGWGIPLLVIVRSLGPGPYDFAGSDNETGNFIATRHLVEAGHKRIGFLGGQSGVVLQGYRKALANAKITFDPSLVIAGVPTRQGGYMAMRQLLAIEPRVTAAACYNDISALGALSALGERGLVAGKDFALMGFDNVLDAEHANPPLSTMDVRPGELGEQAARLLLARIADSSLPPQRFLSSPRLVLRHSA